MISLDIIPCRVSMYSYTSCSVHNPRGRLYLYIHYDNFLPNGSKVSFSNKINLLWQFSNIWSRISQEKCAFFLIYTKEKNRLAPAGTTRLCSSGSKVLGAAQSQANSQKQTSSLNCKAEVNFSQMRHKNTNFENII